MTHKTDTLAQRLRALADELESAQRYGLTLPTSALVSTDVHIHFLDGDQFHEWADYIEADPAPYMRTWLRAEADVNGLTFTVTTNNPSEVAA